MNALRVIYLPGALFKLVDLKQRFTGIHQHPKPAFWVKGHVNWTAWQGKPAVWYEFLLFILLVQHEKLNC